MLMEKLNVNCGRLLSHHQLACCHSYCGIPMRGKDVFVYNNDTQEPTVLTGHHGEVSCITFGKKRRPLLLCSASADYIIVWNIEYCQERLKEGRVAVGTVIGTSLGDVSYLSFSFTDETVAACVGASVYILCVMKQEVICTLTGHLGPLTSAEFCPWNKNLLVTTSEDRTFKVWDLETEAVWYQSFVLSASPLLCTLFLEVTRSLITGSADGQVWCFSVHDEHKCRLVTKMDLEKMEKRHRMLQDTAQHQTETTDWSSEVVTAKPVLTMASWPPSTVHSDEQINTDTSWLCIGSSDGLYVVDLAVSELITVMYFKDFPNLSVTMARSCSVAPGSENSMLVLATSMFTSSIALLELDLGGIGRKESGCEEFSVFPSSPPLPGSPLNAQLKKKKETILPKKKGTKEQPLTFHSKVKSSGYTDAPRTTMFLPKINNPNTLSYKEAKKNIGSLLRDYPADSEAPTAPRTHLKAANKPVYCLHYSGDGRQILCGLGDNSVALYKSSLNGDPAVYAGHDRPVSSVSWSLNRQWWLSASEDHSLRIWTQGRSEPAIIMVKGNSLFPKPIRGAQFYYLDKFLLFASGPSLFLYLYHVDNTHDDIKRYQQRSRVELAGSFTASSPSDITALSAVNGFFSHIVLLCASDRSLQVFDMNKGTFVSRIQEAHSRAAHCITQNKGSMFSTQAPDSYNLFLSSAVTDGVKLWDLRTLRCVRRYQNHINRCHPCSSAISPCGRFIASGSEDGCTYVYDVRSSSCLHKLQKLTDTVLSVTFNPATPQLLTGSLDGKLTLFRP